MSIIQATQEAQVRGQHRQKLQNTEKQKKPSKLLFKHEALCSFPSTKRKKKKIT
jgi:hypothetical protein